MIALGSLFALVVAVAISVAFPFGYMLLLPLVSDLMSESDTGGPILYGFMLAGVFGYAAFASLYVGLRVFTAASSKFVFCAFMLLAVVGQAANAMRSYEEGILGFWSLLGISAVALLGTFWGAGIGVAQAKADIEWRAG